MNLASEKKSDFTKLTTFKGFVLMLLCQSVDYNVYEEVTRTIEMELPNNGFHSSTPKENTEGVHTVQHFTCGKTVDYNPDKF